MTDSHKQGVANTFHEVKSRCILNIKTNFRRTQVYEWFSNFKKSLICPSKNNIAPEVSSLFWSDLWMRKVAANFMPILQINIMYRPNDKWRKVTKMISILSPKSSSGNKTTAKRMKVAQFTSLKNSPQVKSNVKTIQICYGHQCGRCAIA